MPSRPLPFPVIYVGAETGAPPAVKAYDAETGKLTFERNAFGPTFTGGVRVATADFNGDGFPDLAVGAGPGGGPHVRLLDGKTGIQINGALGNFYAFHPSFRGGVEVAAGDVTGDNVPDLIVAASKGGGPHVRVFDGTNGAQLMNFMAFDPDFRGGVSIAAADFTGDGRSELVVGAGVGGGPHVKIFNVATGKTIPGKLGNFFAYEPEFRGGVHVGTDWKTGDYTGDGRADLVVGPGPGHTPDVKIYNGSTGQVVKQFAAFDSKMTAGVRVAMAYVTDDAFADVVVATGVGARNEVRVFDTVTGVQLPGSVGKYTPFGPTNTNGVNIAASNDPPNAHGFYDIPVNESFPIPQIFNPIHITPSANYYTLEEKVNYTDGNTKLHWDITLYNKGMGLEGDFGFTDFGMSYFRMNTHLVTGVTVIDNENYWTGGVGSSNGGEEGFITWTSTKALHPGQSVLLSFLTPVVAPVDGDSVGASFPPDAKYGGYKYEAATACPLVVPGAKSEFQVSQVDYSGATYFPVVNDPGTPAYPSAPPHWIDANIDGDTLDTGEYALPVGFVRNSQGSIGARFLLRPGSSPASGTVLVRGDGPGALDIPTTSANVVGNEVVLLSTQLASLFANHVDYFNGFRILWAISTDNGATWKSAGRSGNEMYVTLNAPAISPVYHTLINLSVPISALVAAADEPTLIAQTWKNFETRTITNKHIRPDLTGKPLTYYKEWDATAGTANALLAALDGACGGFAEAFGKAIRAAGAPTTLIEGVQVKSKTAGEVMLIKSWDFAVNGTANKTVDTVVYPYQNILADPTKNPNNPFASFIRKNAQNVWEYYWEAGATPTVEVTDKDGVPGQNTANPKSSFEDHWFVEIGGKIYDPSYGTGPFDSRQKWEDASVAGFYKVDEVAANNFRLILRKNPAGEDIKETPNGRVAIP